MRAYSIYRQNERVRPIEETDTAIPFDLVRQLHGPHGPFLQPHGLLRDSYRRVRNRTDRRECHTIDDWAIQIPDE
jgi:hypothetical protein